LIHRMQGSPGEARSASRGRLLLLALLCTVAGCAAFAASAAAAIPAPTTEAVTEVSYGSAKVSGKVDPGTEGAYWYLQYSTDGVTWGSWGFNGPIAANAGPTDVETTLEGLKASTKYFVRLVAIPSNFSEEVPSAAPYPEFTTLGPVPAPAVVSIENAHNVFNTSAEFSAQVERPSGNANAAFDAFCVFEVVTDEQFDSSGFEGAGQYGCEPENPIKTQGVSTVTGKATFLNTSTEFHLRLRVYNAGGEDVQEAAATFTTLPPAGPPTVTMDPVSAIAPHTAHFVGTINPGGKDPTQELNWHFECTPACPNLPGGTVQPSSAPVTVERDAKELKAGTEYTVKLVAQNYAGAESSATRVFTTETTAPSATTGAANVTGTTASIFGQLRPGGLATEYHFEWGTAADNLDQGTPTQTTLANDERTGVGAKLEGLVPGATYYFRLVASNAQGSDAGNVKSLVTSPSPAGCPNEAIREQQRSRFLPECRGYELVSPASDEYGDIPRVPAISDSGDTAAVMATTPGEIASHNPLYWTGVSKRTSGGWITYDASVRPWRSMASQPAFQNPLFFSPDLQREILATPTNATPGNEEEGTWFYRTEIDTGGDSVQIGSRLALPTVIGATPDLSAMVYNELFQDSFGHSNIYYTDIDAGSTEVISKLPNGEAVNAGVAGGAATRGYPSVPGLASLKVAHGGTHGASDDLRRVYFYSLSNANSRVAMWMRDTVADETIPIGVSQRSGDVGTHYLVDFFSSTHSGENVYFLSGQQLTDAATPGGGIYRYNVVTDNLEQITPAAGDPAGLQIPGDRLSALLSDDESHIYFVSPRALTPDAEENARNIYVTTATGTKLVATGDGSTWPDRVTRDGRYLLFESTSSIDGAPNGNKLALYEYDHATGDVSCASCRADGTPNEFAANLDKHTFAWPTCCVVPRNISDDGKVFFGSADRLLPGDENSALDVYMYDRGSLYLMSTGKSSGNSYIVENTDDGSDVFIVTRQGITSQDRDPGELDVYDVRVDGGFLDPPPVVPCEIESCRSGVSQAPPPAAPVTPKFIGANNKQSSRNQGRQRRNKHKHHKKHHKHHKKQGKKHRQQAQGKHDRRVGP
jgi:hypothetical protein